MTAIMQNTHILIIRSIYETYTNRKVGVFLAEVCYWTVPVGIWLYRLIGWGRTWNAIAWPTNI